MSTLIDTYIYKHEINKALEQCIKEDKWYSAFPFSYNLQNRILK